MAWKAKTNADGTKKPSKWNAPIALGDDCTLPADAQAQIDTLGKAGLPADTLKIAVDSIRSRFSGENGARAELLTGIDEKTPDLLKIVVGKSDACFSVAKWRALLARAAFIAKAADAADALIGSQTAK